MKILNFSHPYILLLESYLTILSTFDFKVKILLISCIFLLIQIALISFLDKLYLNEKLVYYYYSYVIPINFNYLSIFCYLMVY
jgi:hypothetical protein